MVEVLRAADRGHTQIGWLDSWHTFSFGEYYDPSHMGFRALRVLNDDRVRPGMGFGTHGHRDMEILSYVLEGELEHKDSMGNGSIIRPGEIQFMRAGTGVQHSEYNPSEVNGVHFLQIWIVPDRNGLQPAYAQKTFDRARAAQGLVLLASLDGRDGSVQVQRDVSVYVTQPAPGVRYILPLAPGRHAWVHVARGAAVVQGEDLAEGDAVAMEGEPEVRVEGREGAEVLVFDLA